MAQGIDKIPLRIPPQWDPKWFADFIRDVLAKADIRNAVEGPGITIEGQPDEPATISSSEDLTQLLEQTFVLALPSGFLDDERILQGEQDIIDIIDEGPGGDIIVALVDGGTPLYKLQAIAALSVVANPTSGAIPPTLVTADANDKFFVRRAGALTFDTLADGDIPAGIARDSEVTAAIAALNLDSGVYTPTLTNVANLDASTAYQCQYLRVGSVVTVSGKVDIDPTAAVSTQLGISLPIASNLGASEDCAGTAFASGIAGQGAAILGDATNNRAQLQFVAGDLTNQPMYFSFTYRVI